MRHIKWSGRDGDTRRADIRVRRERSQHVLQDVRGRLGDERDARGRPSEGGDSLFFDIATTCDALLLDDPDPSRYQILLCQILVW